MKYYKTTIQVEIFYDEDTTPWSAKPMLDPDPHHHYGQNFAHSKGVIVANREVTREQMRELLAAEGSEHLLNGETIT